MMVLFLFLRRLKFLWKKITLRIGFRFELLCFCNFEFGIDVMGFMQFGLDKDEGFGFIGAVQFIATWGLQGWGVGFRRWWPIFQLGSCTGLSLSYFLNYSCCKSVLFLNVAVVCIQNADNYQNCGREWRWKNISWQVSIQLCPVVPFNRVQLI